MLHHLCPSANNIRIIKSRMKLEYTAEMRNAFKILGQKPDYSKDLGIEEDNIKNGS